MCVCVYVCMYVCIYIYIDMNIIIHRPRAVNIYSRDPKSGDDRGLNTYVVCN